MPSLMGWKDGLLCLCIHCDKLSSKCCCRTWTSGGQGTDTWSQILLHVPCAFQISKLSLIAHAYKIFVKKWRQDALFFPLMQLQIRQKLHESLNVCMLEVFLGGWSFAELWSTVHTFSFLLLHLIYSVTFLNDGNCTGAKLSKRYFVAAFVI